MFPTEGRDVRMLGACQNIKDPTDRNRFSPRSSFELQNLSIFNQLWPVQKRGPASTSRAIPHWTNLQGYLARMKMPPPRALPWAYV